MTTRSTAESLPGFEHLAAPAEKQPRRRAARRAEELLEGLNEPQRAAVVHEGSAAARRRRRGLRQDPGADPPDRLADLRAQGAPRLDPGDHLHQQGRGRDEAAGRGPGRPAGPDHVGLDVPLRLRPDPAQGDHRARLRGACLQVVVLDLRRGRPEAADDQRRQGARPRPEAVPARLAAALGLRPQERAARRGGRRPRRRRTSSRSPTPRRTRSTRSGCGRPTPSTSTT